MYVSKPNPSRSKKNKAKTNINIDKNDYATDAKRFEYWEKFKESL